MRALSLRAKPQGSNFPASPGRDKSAVQNAKRRGAWAPRRFAGGELLQRVIELDTTLVFMNPVGDRASLVAMGPPDVDAGAVAYEMTELSERFAERPPVLPRLSVPGPG